MALSFQRNGLREENIVLDVNVPVQVALECLQLGDADAVGRAAVSGTRCVDAAQAGVQAGRRALD
jgi:hypothetical protein